MVFPVGRIQRHLHEGRYASRIGSGAAVYMAGVLEYLSAEILELSGNAAKDNRKARITPRHIMLAIKNDIELNELLKNVTIPDGGVMPGINPILLPANSKTKKRNQNKEKMSLEIESDDGEEGQTDSEILSQEH